MNFTINNTVFTDNDFSNNILSDHLKIKSLNKVYDVIYKNSTLDEILNLTYTKNDFVSDFLKGKVSEIKIWDKFIPKENIDNILFDNLENPTFDLNTSDVVYNNCDITYESFEVYNNPLPYRREGRFLSLPHADEGFVNGKWAKGETTAENERRFFLEMKKEKINYKEDGIAQIKYNLVSKEQIADNAWMINVKL
jgi:hypothetical protein